MAYFSPLSEQTPERHHRRLAMPLIFPIKPDSLMSVMME